MMQKPMPGAARMKRNSWNRGSGVYSMRGELKRGISLNKKRLNRKVRHRNKDALKGCSYKRIGRTVHMVDFT